MKEGHIFIGAHARSGSTYLCRLLGQIAAIKAYREVFHQRHGMIKRHLEGDYARVAHRLRLSEVGEVAREQIAGDPQAFIDALADLNPGQIIAFKVFPGHLSGAGLQQALRGARLVLLLERNLLHAHISSRIAMKTNRWGGHDTSTVKTRFHPDKFRQYCARITQYQNRVSDLADRLQVPITRLQYETMVDERSVLADLAAQLGRLLDCRLTVKRRPHDSRKQDRRVLASEKVTNPEELLEFLNRNDLSALNDGRRRMLTNPFPA
jgi:LPS sulfotransferase NodH